MLTNAKWIKNTKTLQCVSVDFTKVQHEYIYCSKKIAYLISLRYIMRNNVTKDVNYVNGSKVGLGKFHQPLAPSRPLFKKTHLLYFIKVVHIVIHVYVVWPSGKSVHISLDIYPIYQNNVFTKFHPFYYKVVV